MMQTMTSVSPALQTVVHWPHAKGGEDHCLARIYQCPDANIAVLSEIRSNSLNKGLIRDLAGATEALLPSLAQLQIDPGCVTWFIHHGPFSDYDTMWTLQREDWSQASFAWDGQHYQIDWANWENLSPTQVEALHQSIMIEPVLDVLNAIGWAQR